MKRIQKFILGLTTISVVIFSVFLLWVSNQYVVPIMMYHHVVDAQEQKPDTVSPIIFEEHMEYLYAHRYNVISLDEFVKRTLSGKELPRKTVVITFDDGFVDNYTEAFAILKKFQFPATMFVPSDFIGQKGQMSLEQLKEMIGEDISIGSHTRTHEYLPDLTAEQQIREIVESKEILEEKLGVKIDHFAYPVGGFTAKIKNIVSEVGYQSASTTNRGQDRFNKDVYELNRIRFSDNDNHDFYLWAKLSGFYNLFRTLKNSH